MLNKERKKAIVSEINFIQMYDIQLNEQHARNKYKHGAPDK
jgi:hypothetical protein